MSEMRPPVADLKRIWLYAYARSSLIQADQWILELEHIDTNSSAYRALITAIVVAYARPFTQSQVSSSERAVPLRDVSPPTNLSDTHRDLLNLRNKVIGHADALPAVGHTETPNKVLIVRDKTGFNLHTVLTADMTSEEKQNVRALCRHFIAHCDAQLDDLVRRYGAELPTTPGTYEVLIVEPPAEWIRRFNPVVAE